MRLPALTTSTVLLGLSAFAGLAALGVAAVASAAGQAVALVAALTLPALWVDRPLLRGHAVVPLVVGLVCVLVVSGNGSVMSAAGAGVLVLLHVVLADLATDATGATRGAVGLALGEMRTGLVAGLVAAVAAAGLVALGLAGTALLPDDLGRSVRVLSPWLLLLAALLALGLASRRRAWQLSEDRRGLSGVTRRYLDRLSG